jgi:hypothetical protein
MRTKAYGSSPMVARVFDAVLSVVVYPLFGG